VRLSARSDDADVIRARLRLLLQQFDRGDGWVPTDPADDDGDEQETIGPAADDEPASDDDAEPASDDDTEPVSDDDTEPAAAVDLDEGGGRHRAPGTAVRLSPGRQGVWALCAAALVAALALVAWTWLDRPRVTPPGSGAIAASTASPSAGRSVVSPAVGEAAATSATVVVSVVGQVVRPGLVTLPAGARVADAVAAAGGLVPGADPASVNLAAVVSDGQQVAVGVPGATGGSPAAAGGAAAATGQGPVNLNTATVAELDALPGIGPVLAQRIVDYRSQQGRFTSVDQLDDVPGIGPTLYSRLAGSVSV
jgi:competence protein ComEA